MIKVIVFDCDGVMFDSRPANKAYYNHLLFHFNKQEMDEEELQYVHSHNVNDSITHIFRNHSEITLKDIEQYRNTLDYAAFLPFFKMEKDLIPFLEKAKRDYYLAISTARTDTMDLLLDQFGLTKYFGKVMTSANSPKPKPAPDGMYEILDHFNCQPTEAVFIGDSSVDYEHAKASGVQLIAFKNRGLKTETHVECFMDIFHQKLLS